VLLSQSRCPIAATFNSVVAPLGWAITIADKNLVLSVVRYHVLNAARPHVTAWVDISVNANAPHTHNETLAYERPRDVIRPSAGSLADMTSSFARSRVVGHRRRACVGL
jgi:hypothetical protein